MARRSTFVLGLALVILSSAGLAFLLMWLTNDRGGEGAVGPPPATILLTRIAPPPGAGDEIAAEPMTFVNFEYEVRNQGAEPLRGLKPGLTCGCQVLQKAPEVLNPGSAARIAFRLRAGPRGRVQHRIEITADGEPGPLAVLHLALRVKFTPPALVSAPDTPVVMFIDGEHRTQDLVFDAAERKGTPPWITGIRIDPPDCLRVVSLDVQQRPEPDPGLLIRTYRFRLARGSAGIGQQRACMTLKTRSSQVGAPPSSTLGVEVLDRVAIVPNPVRLSPGSSDRPGSARVIVLQRAGEGRVEVAQFDRDQIDVRRESGETGKAATFDIIARRNVKQRSETKVRFRVGDRGSREVVVRLEPQVATR